MRLTVFLHSMKVLAHTISVSKFSMWVCELVFWPQASPSQRDLLLCDDVWQLRMIIIKGWSIQERFRELSCTSNEFMFLWVLYLDSRVKRNSIYTLRRGKILTGEFKNWPHLKPPIVTYYSKGYWRDLCFTCMV